MALMGGGSGSLAGSNSGGGLAGLLGANGSGAQLSGVGSSPGIPGMP